MKRTFLLLLALSLLACLPLAAEEIGIDLNPSRTSVTFTLGDVLHTVHGAFKLKRGNVRFDPGTGKAGGEIVVDVASGDSGNDARDRRMHKDILESAKYPEAVFIPDHFTGTVAAEGESRIDAHGMFQFHGTNHEMTLPFLVHNHNGELSATADFVIPYVRWGLKNPSTFVLRVSDKVQMHIQASGSMQPSGAATAQR
jgi:polyisoprenoid-binding protein YceI